MNPDPLTGVQESTLDSIRETVRRLMEEQTTVLNEVRQLKESQLRTDAAVFNLSKRMTAVESEISSLAQARLEVSSVNTEIAGL